MKSHEQTFWVVYHNRIPWTEMYVYGNNYFLFVATCKIVNVYLKNTWDDDKISFIIDVMRKKSFGRKISKLWIVNAVRGEGGDSGRRAQLGEHSSLIQQHCVFFNFRPIQFLNRATFVWIIAYLSSFESNATTYLKLVPGIF